MNFKRKKIEPLLRFEVRRILQARDVYTLLILALYTLLASILYTQLDNAGNLILVNLTIGFLIIAVSYISVEGNGGRIFLLFKRIYIIPIIFFIYDQVQYYIRVINPHLYDDMLIRWDYILFGVNPTEWLMQFTTPVLTEFLQFSYMTYFFLPLILGIELHRRKNYHEFNQFASMILFSFYFSYILYFIFPAIGPRFTIHEFSSTYTEMPGIWLADFFREMVNRGGGIPEGAADPVKYVNRDCMPSGHTWVTAVVIYLAFKYRSFFRWVILLFGISLIIGTVYLRYHYVVDIIAGLILAAMTIYLEPKIRILLKKAGFSKIRE